MRLRRWNSLKHLTPARILVIGFATLIFLGAVLLSLPIATQNGESLPFTDALFTATSAVCVTGLVVVDTGTYFNTFGQVVILTLIQIGALGFMTLTTFITIIIGGKIGLKGRLIIQESLNVNSLAGLIRLTRNVVIITLLIELIFALILTTRFTEVMPFGKALYYGIFHAVSAFCNAGFDLFGDYKSLSDYVGDPIVNFAIMFLIVLGGLGFTVLVDLWQRTRGVKLSVHSKLVLIITAVLLVSGTLLYYGLENGNANTIGTLSEGDKWLASAFASTTARTAGYATINYETLTEGGSLWTIILMFIGASPGSTGGGIKTITALMIILLVWMVITNKETVVVSKRSIPQRLIYKSLVISVMAITAIVAATLLLTITEDTSQTPLVKYLFEATSAFSTVGLSMNLTPTLSTPGKLIILVLMYIGRLGPLTIALALAQRRGDKANVKYPEANLYVG